MKTFSWLETLCLPGFAVGFCTALYALFLFSSVLIVVGVYSIALGAF